MALDPVSALVHWMDERLVIVDKPSGMLTLPDGYDREKPHLRSLLEPEVGQLWIVHRLDKDTSGLIVLARDAEAHRHLNGQFERGEVAKTYLAVVQSIPVWETQELAWRLRVDGDRRHRTVIDPHRGKPARTICRRLRAGNGLALLEIKPQTGRTHQIRAHLSAAGHPILGDRLYAGQPEHTDGRLGRMALHASGLEFRHPGTDKALAFELPLPEDMAQLIPGVAPSRQQRGSH